MIIKERHKGTSKVDIPFRDPTLPYFKLFFLQSSLNSLNVTFIKTLFTVQALFYVAFFTLLTVRCLCSLRPGLGVNLSKFASLNFVLCGQTSLVLKKWPISSLYCPGSGTLQTASTFFTTLSLTAMSFQTATRGPTSSK